MADAPLERFMKARLGLLLCCFAISDRAAGHDIPDERVDRTIRVVLSPGRIDVEYELSLSEFAALLDLKRLEGPGTPGRGDQEVWARYGRLVGPLNGAGLLVDCDGQQIVLDGLGFTWEVENHLIYSFRFGGKLPRRGRLRFRDTNYLSGAGRGRLGVIVMPGVQVDGTLPTFGEDSARPVWALTDEEEAATRAFEVGYVSHKMSASSTIDPPPNQQPNQAVGVVRLDLRSRGAWICSWLMAVLLGAGHAVQPGHGKLVIASVAVEGTAARMKGAVLAFIVAATHLGSVLVLAGLLWASRSARFAEMDQALKMGAGSLVAVLGVYRVGRFFAGRLEREEKSVDAGSRGGAGWWLAGVAAGLIPCWDAVLLVLLAEAEGRLALGIWVLTGFSAGLLLVQLLVAEGSRRVGPALERRGWMGLGHWLGLASGLGLAAIGLLLVGR